MILWKLFIVMSDTMDDYVNHFVSFTDQPRTADVSTSIDIWSCFSPRRSLTPFIFHPNLGSVNRLCFANNDCTLLAIASSDGTISVCICWPPQEAKRVVHILSGGHQRGAAVTDLIWSLSNEFIVSTSVDGSVCLWNVSNGRLIRHYTSSTISVGPALVCSYQPQNYNLLLIGGAWGCIQTINLSTGKAIKKGRDQVHFVGYKSHKSIDTKHFACLGQGCVTAVTFDASTGTSLWVGTDRGVIQSYVCQPSTGRLTRAHRLNLSSGSIDIPSTIGSHRTDVLQKLDDPIGDHHMLKATKITRIQHYNRLALRHLSSVVHGSSYLPGVTSLTVHSWLSRESGDTFLLANASGLGLLLFQVHTPGTSLSLRKRFPITHEPANPMNNRGLRLLHSTFAPLLSFRSGACAISASEDCNIYVFDVLRSTPNDDSFDPPNGPGKHVPGLVTVLQGHAAPVLDISIGWDESILASGDADGSVILWRRLQVDDGGEVVCC